MPPLPGEERLLTTYADVHYYFSSPSPHPLQHRFDKGSYLYIYHDGAQNKARIEIANNADTPEIDAFCGSLESVLLSNSHEFPTRCTLVVDDRRQSSTSLPPNQIADANDWRLACMNTHDENWNLLRLHTLDIYFWTLDDVGLFLATARRLLAPNQLNVVPCTPQERTLSSVVQQLENVAVSDSSFGHSQMRTPVSAASSLPPPPAASRVLAPSSHTYTTSRPVSPLEEQTAQRPTEPSEAAQNYAPLAYNPAAPAAPEPVKHREKTPPPPDADVGTGRGAVSVISHGSPSFGPPPQAAAPYHLGQGYPGGYLAYSSPPPSAGLTQPGQMLPHIANHNSSGSLSFAPPPAPATPNAPTQAGKPSGSMSFASPSQDPNVNVSSAPSGQPGQMAFAPPPQDPNIHFHRQQSFGQQSMTGQYTPGQQTPYMDRRGSQPPPPPPSQPQIQPPIGGYVEYSYNQPNQQAPNSGNPYDIHAHLYRPTEAEVAGNYRDNNPEYTKGGRKPGKITENAMRVEKGMNRLLKKLDKRL